MPELDKKAASVFAGKVVRKDLVRKVKVGANVPVFVLEYLLGKYCATDDPVAIDAGLKVVTFHAAWEYFADAVPIEIVGTIEPKPAITPSPAQVKQTIDLMRQQGVRVVICETYDDDNLAKSIADQAGAKMVNAVSHSVGPKITVIVGGSFGAGHYAMCGKAYDPRFLFAWPTARYAVMSGDSAASVLVEIKLKQLERSGQKITDEQRQELTEATKKTYDEQTDPRYGAARLWIDKIIDPIDTRDAITLALEAAALNPEVAEFKVGVLQT